MIDIAKSLEELDTIGQIEKKKKEIIRAITIASELAINNKKDGVSLNNIDFDCGINMNFKEKPENDI